VVWEVWGYVVGGTLVSTTTQQCTINAKKYCTIHNTDTVAYATPSGSYSSERKKRSTLATHWYTTFTAVHNIHSSAEHIDDTEMFRLPERQIASAVIFV